MMTYDIQLTESAKEHIKRLLDKQGGIAFRLSIKKTGCSGYSYVPSIVNEISPEETVLNEIADFPVLIDTQYADLLQTLRIDLVEENNMGLKQKKLMFVNPKESGRCGCGESFHINEVK